MCVCVCVGCISHMHALVQSWGKWIRTVCSVLVILFLLSRFDSGADLVFGGKFGLETGFEPGTDLSTDLEVPGSNNLSKAIAVNVGMALHYQTVHI